MDSKKLPDLSGNESTEEILNLMNSKEGHKTGSILMPLSKERSLAMNETDKKDSKDKDDNENRNEEIRKFWKDNGIEHVQKTGSFLMPISKGMREVMQKDNKDGKDNRQEEEKPDSPK